MGKKQGHDRPGSGNRPHRQVTVIPVDTRTIIYVEANGTYQLQPGSPLRDMSCLTCGLPAGGQPVQLSFLSRQDLCNRSTGHAPAVMFIRHLACLNPDNTTIRDAILISLMPCLPDAPASWHDNRGPG